MQSVDPQRTIGGWRNPLCRERGAWRQGSALGSSRTFALAARRFLGAGPRAVSRRGLECGTRWPARLRAGGHGSEWAAPSSAGPAAARVSALRELTRGNCLSGASAARAASFAAGRGTEQRRGEPGRARVPADSCPPGEPVRLASRTVDVGAQRRPPTAERTGPPARSLARVDATSVSASQATNSRNRANVRKGPFADPLPLPRFMRRGSHQVRWSN